MLSQYKGVGGKVPESSVKLKYEGSFGQKLPEVGELIHCQGLGPTNPRHASIVQDNHIRPVSILDRRTSGIRALDFLCMLLN